MKEKKSFRVPRGGYLLFAVLVSGEATGTIRQAWLKYKWGDVLGVSAADTIRTGVLALLFTILALAAWYCWLTYNKKKQINDNT